MFILRKISRDGVEASISLGKSYSVVSNERSPLAFKSECNRLNVDGAAITAFVYDESGAAYGLNQDYASIITESGGVFEQFEFKFNIKKKENCNCMDESCSCTTVKCATTGADK